MEEEEVYERTEEEVWAFVPNVVPRCVSVGSVIIRRNIMTKNELENKKYPYLDPLPKYDGYNILGGILIFMGIMGIIYICLYLTNGL